MNKIERITAVVEGRQPDRPPVSFWYHFGPEAVAGPRAVEAHLRHVETYDLDFLKVMNDNRYPRKALPGGVVADVQDLEKLSVLNGDEATFGRQLDLIRELARHTAGQLRMTTTIFNSWSALRQMTAPESGAHGPPTVGGPVDAQDAAMSRFLHEAPDTLSRALRLLPSHWRTLPATASLPARMGYSSLSAMIGSTARQMVREPTLVWSSLAILRSLPLLSAGRSTSCTCAADRWTSTALRVTRCR